MRLQPNRNYVSNDDIQTPPALARRLVQHFQPTGRILEPCAGDGNFLRALRSHVRQSHGAATARFRSKRLATGSNARTLSSQLSATDSPRASHVYSCELKRGSDFFAYDRPVDWIITNPPWSQFRRFLQHALAHADHVVFLITINHLWTRARQHDLRVAGFSLKEIVMVDTPKIFPPMGFQLGALYLRRQWTGPVTLTDWTKPVDGGALGAPGGAARYGGRSDGGPAAEEPDVELEEILEINRRLDALLARVAKQ